MISFIIKKLIIFPIIFLVVVFSVAYTEQDAISKNNKKTYFIHDLLGAKILTNNNINFTKIITVKNNDVIFCDKNNSKYLFLDRDKTIIIKENNSFDCNNQNIEDGKKEDNGIAPLISSILNAIKERKPEKEQDKATKKDINQNETSTII